MTTRLMMKFFDDSSKISWSEVLETGGNCKAKYLRHGSRKKPIHVLFPKLYLVKEIDRVCILIKFYQFFFCKKEWHKSLILFIEFYLYLKNLALKNDSRFSYQTELPIVCTLEHIGATLRVMWLLEKFLCTSLNNKKDLF